MNSTGRGAQQSPRSRSQPHLDRPPQSGLRRLLARSAALVLRRWGSTWRFEFEGSDPTLDADRPAIAAIWHRDFLIATFLFRDRRYSAPVSRSRDGELIAEALQALGYVAPPRGSSSLGGAAALRGLVRLLRDGHSVAVPTDGPRGPARRSKIGVIALSRIAEIPVTPISFAAHPCIRFRSWDRTRLPLPFARITCRYGTSIAVATDIDDEEAEALRVDLDQTLEQDGDEVECRYIQD